MRSYELLSMIFGVSLLFGPAARAAEPTPTEMVIPAKVLAFLDVFGNHLAFVMGGAAAASALGYLVAKRRGVPVFMARLKIPTHRGLDQRPIGGAALFGRGWALVGLCSGPSLTLTFGPFLVFVLAIAARPSSGWRPTISR